MTIDYNQMIELFQYISDTCNVTRYCIECKFYSKNSGVCVFDDMPRYWDHEELKSIERRMQNDNRL